jgi:hypothetical protein
MVFALSRDHKPGWVVGAGVLAGLMFGASWLCKESVVYSIPFCALLLTFRWRAGIPLGIGMLIGVVAIFGGEMLAYGYSAGDPLFRLHETERNYSQNAKYFFTEGSRWGWPVGESFASAVRRRLFVSGPATIFLNRQALFAPLLAAVAVMYGLASRDRRFFAPALWFLTLALAFNFASSSLSVYRPLVLFDRYLLPVFFAATVLCGGLLSALLWPTERAAHGMARIGGRVAGLCLAGGLFWVASTEVYLGVKYRPRWWAADVRVLADTIQPHDRVFADTLSLRGLRFFQAYPTPTSWTDFDEIDAGTRLPVGSTIIVNQPYLNWLRTNGGLWGDRTSGYAGDAFLATIAANWTVVWHGENTTVYRVDERAAEESVARRPISNVP